MAAVPLPKRLPNGGAACGIPLWLELAVKEPLLLDADDFARTEQFQGSAVEKLHALPLFVAEELPAGVEELCGYLLERTEKLHGVAFARASTELIALSRTGLAGIGLAGHAAGGDGRRPGPWRFAALRTERHRQVVEHLEKLPPDDLLQQTELMVHMIRAGLKQAAAAPHSGPLPAAGEAGATAALAAYIPEGQAHDSGAELDWVLSLAHKDLEDNQIRNLCRRWHGP